ncbi:MAG: TonB-dependent receptor plug domain-containing protein, partial [Bacteroidales bacterium]|nr:TonB-dependent receptor plug domain-containing protein [Bacteroidales bacterium]
MKKLITIIFLMLFAQLLAFGQNTVTGTVFDQNAEPLPGVAVIVKGTSKASLTDSKGKYSISAKKGETLVFSCLGMRDEEITVTGDSHNVKMLVDSYALDDAVVIGYGSVRKSDLTGAVASVRADDLKNTKIGMVSSGLQGMAAGVQVTQGNMKPGAGAGIIIRGIGSVNAGGVLCIIDGVPGDLNNIAPQDIASIELLTDASSAAIYGSRGSGGVILITTKRGDANHGRVSFTAQYGVQKMLNKQNMMNAAQYYEVVQSSGQPYVWTAEELRLLSEGGSTDWQDAVSQLGTFQNYNVSASGGTDKVTHFMGVDYYDHNGIIKNSSFNKLSVRYNMDAQIKENIRAGARVNIVNSYIKNINEEGDSGYGTMFSAISSQPTAPIYNDDGSYFDGFLNTKANPVAMVELLDKGSRGI